MDRRGDILEMSVLETVTIRRWLVYLLRKEEIFNNLTNENISEINELIDRIDERIEIDDLI